MSAVSKTVIVASLILALGAIGKASDASEDWLARPNTGYAVDMNGNPTVINLPPPSDEMMARAQAVHGGTVFFKHQGKVMMTFDRKMVGK